MDNQLELQSIQNYFDAQFTYALRRKGYEFDTEPELIKFVKENCRYADHQSLKQRIYYVNDMPFLLHKYGEQPNFKTQQTDTIITITAVAECFAYL